MFNSNMTEAVVTFEVLVDLLGESESLGEPMSAGGCMSHRVAHPEHGNIILVQTACCDECMVFKA